MAKLNIIKNGECTGAEVVRVLSIKKKLSIEWLSLCKVIL